MTFHVLYNDCHLEADVERESVRETAQQRGERKRGGERGGRREEGGGQSADENGLGHLWFLTQTQHLFPPTTLWSLSFLPALKFSASIFPCHWSPFTCHQRKLSSFKADYKMNCTEPRRCIFSLELATTAKGQS